MTKLYIDANVIIDAIKNQNNLFGTNLGNPATNIFYRALSCEFHLIISTWTLSEVYKKVKVEDVKMIFTFVKNKIITIKHSNKDMENAKKRSRDNYQDALHIILAERANADVIITSDIDDFIRIGTKIRIRKPKYF